MTLNLDRDGVRVVFVAVGQVLEAESLLAWSEAQSGFNERHQQ
jgi:hypothetical protein